MSRWQPRAADWNLEVALLAEIRDRMGQALTLLADLPAGVKKRSKPPPAFPRPQTAIDRARAQLELAMESELDDLIAAAHATYAAEQSTGMDGGVIDGVPCG